MYITKYKYRVPKRYSTTDKDTITNRIFKYHIRNGSIQLKSISQFLNTDIIKGQFKSNYDTNTVNVVQSNGIINNIPVIQKTNNIGKMDYRDAIISANGAKTYIQFSLVK